MKKILIILGLLLLYLGATMTGGMGNLVTGGLALVIVILGGIAFVSSVIFKSKVKRHARFDDKYDKQYYKYRKKFK